jgi:hypothetical protein
MNRVKQLGYFSITAFELCFQIMPLGRYKQTSRAGRHYTHQQTLELSDTVQLLVYDVVSLLSENTL